MDLDDVVGAVLNLYPRLFFACHRRHVREPESGELLSAHQASILDHLDVEQPVSLGELATHMGVTPGTMSPAVDRLTRLGLLRRARDEEGGRRLNLRLTPAGVRVSQAHSVLDPGCLRAALAQLSAEERAAVVHGLELLARGTEAASAARSGERRGPRRT